MTSWTVYYFNGETYIFDGVILALDGKSAFEKAKEMHPDKLVLVVQIKK